MKILRIILGIAIYAISLTNVAVARPWFIEPVVLFSAGYEDNPFLIADEEEIAIDGDSEIEDTGSQSFGEIGGRIRLGTELESDLIAFDAAAFARRYDDSILDTERFFASFLYNNLGLVHDWGFETGYVERTSISSFIADPTGTIGFDEFGRFRGDRDIQEIYIRPSLTSRFSTNLLGEGTFRYRDVTFDEPIDTTTDYEDFQLNYQLRQTVSERTSVSGLVNVLLYRPTEPVTTLGEIDEEDVTDVQIGFDYIAAENLTLFLSAGAGYRETTLLGLEGVSRFTDTIPTYNASVNYTGLRNTFSFIYNRGFESIGGGGLSERERFSFVYSRAETLGGELGLDAYLLKRDSTPLEPERDLFYISPRILWDINANLSLSFRIQYRQDEIFDDADNSINDADSTAYLIGVTYDWGRRSLGR